MPRDPRPAIALLALFTLTWGNCSSCRKTSSSSTVDGAGDNVAPPAEPVGMVDPFARLGSQTAKGLSTGYKALRGRKYDEALAAFTAVVQAAPDYTAARFHIVRTAALAGRYDEVPGFWKDLLLRDYVAYAGRLSTPRELAALRAQPAWADIQRIEAALKKRYADGLTSGLLFVARTRDPGPPSFDPASGLARLSLAQELYHFDPASARYRRVSETGGNLFAYTVSPDRKLVAFVVTPKLAKHDEQVDFVEPRAGLLDLTTLETTGPLKLIDRTAAITLAWNGSEPRWVVDGRSYTFDATHTAMVPTSDNPPAAETPHSTVVTAETVAHFGSAPGGARRGGDQRSVVIDGQDKPLRAAREIAPASIHWSPGKKRLVYTGVLDACAVLAKPKPTAEDNNELYLWDAQTKLALRVAAAVSHFDTHWLDDDHLVYEGGVGRQGKLHIYEVSTRKDTILAPRYGAGLYGYPSLSCSNPVDAVDQEGLDQVDDTTAGENSAETPPPPESGP